MPSTGRVKADGTGTTAEADMSELRVTRLGSTRLAWIAIATAIAAVTVGAPWSAPAAADPEAPTRAAEADVPSPVVGDSSGLIVFTVSS